MSGEAELDLGTTVERGQKRRATYRAVRINRDMILESDGLLATPVDDTDAAANSACRSKIS